MLSIEGTDYRYSVRFVLFVAFAFAVFLFVSFPFPRSFSFSLPVCRFPSVFVFALWYIMNSSLYHNWHLQHLVLMLVWMYLSNKKPALLVFYATRYRSKSCPSCVLGHPKKVPTKKHKKGKQKVGTKIRPKIVAFQLKIHPFLCFRQIGTAHGPWMPRRAWFF